MFIVKD